MEKSSSYLFVFLKITYKDTIVNDHSRLDENVSFKFTVTFPTTETLSTFSVVASATWKHHSILSRLNFSSRRILTNKILLIKKLPSVSII